MTAARARGIRYITESLPPWSLALLDGYFEMYVTDAAE